MAGVNRFVRVLAHLYDLCGASTPQGLAAPSFFGAMSILAIFVIKGKCYLKIEAENGPAHVINVRGCAVCC